MRHTEIALRRPVTTVMVFVALALIGLIATRLLPLEKFPDIVFPGIFVQIPYQGSTPEEIERLITRPVEESLATLSGVERMESTTTESQSQINLFFGWDQNVSAAGIDARAKVDAIRDELPADVERVNVFTGSFSDQPILVLRISSDRDLSNAYAMLERHVKRRIERVEGVSRVELQGVEPPEIRILIDADRASAHHVNLRSLRELLARSNFAVSAGSITANGERFSVRPTGELKSLAEIEDIIVDRGDVRLRDIATVELRSPERNYGRHLNGKYAIGLNVYKTTGANMVQVSDGVLAEVDEISRLPQMRGISIIDLDNHAEGVRSSLSDLLKSGLLGAVFAIVVLYLFLRQAATTLIVMLSVPFSLLITLGAMFFFGLSLNILSMMGLMLAVGMLVDNAVVVTESIFRHRQLAPDKPFEATLSGVREVGLAVTAGTLTSIIVFVPIMFGEKNEIMVFLTHVAVTIVVALIASLLIAQTLVPMLAARVRPPPQPKRTALMTRLTERYVGALDWTLRHRWWTALTIIVVLAAGLTIPPRFIHFDTFPQESSRRLFLSYHIEGTHPLSVVERVAVDRVEGFLFANADELEIRDVYSYFDEGRAETTILLAPEDEATVPTRTVIERIEEGLPQIIIGHPSFQFDQQGGGEGFSVQLSGDSTERLAELAESLLRVLAGVDGLYGLRSEATAGDAEVRIVVDREKAMAAGLDTLQIAQVVGTAMRGDQLPEFRGTTDEISVRLAFRDSDRSTLADLADISLYLPTGRTITLGSVADFRIERGPRAIQRVDRQTAVVIGGNLEPDVGLDDVKPEVEELMDQFALPPGYAWKFGRGFEETDETQQVMAVNILLGVALIFIVMAALFESVLYPLSIITSIAFSIVGVFLFFMITGTTFSFMASIGIMILIGVVVNNGIVLIDHINNLRSEGMPRNEAILQGGRDRLRPILMTVATTILGLLPLAVGVTQIGGDGPPYFPMARAIIGGLAFSTLTSLLVVPSVYVWFDGAGKWARKVRAVAVKGDSPDFAS
ncbi:MAG TPA: efflux RND transporter permease subunit [Gammaproteobacteria bacterium]|nr:efflux RND transporter permease subunit [Gammaproteobacteria bacterium]